jgi:hypothetical protein
MFGDTVDAEWQDAKARHREMDTDRAGRAKSGAQAVAKTSLKTRSGAA